MVGKEMLLVVALFGLLMRGFSASTEKIKLVKLKMHLKEERKRGREEIAVLKNSAKGIREYFNKK